MPEQACVCVDGAANQAASTGPRRHLLGYDYYGYHNYHESSSASAAASASGGDASAAASAASSGIFHIQLRVCQFL